MFVAQDTTSGKEYALKVCVKDFIGCQTQPVLWEQKLTALI